MLPVDVFLNHLACHKATFYICMLYHDNTLYDTLSSLNCDQAANVILSLVSILLDMAISHVADNGCRKAIRKNKCFESFRATPNLVVTIDFGTTYCSVSYLIGVDRNAKSSEMEPTLLKLDDRGSKRVPSCILFDQYGVCKSFGYQARDQYTSLGKTSRPSYAYFEYVKKELGWDIVSLIPS